jgi:hypothetical protein
MRSPTVLLLLVLSLLACITTMPVGAPLLGGKSDAPVDDTATQMANFALQARELGVKIGHGAWKHFTDNATGRRAILHGLQC